MTQEQVPTIKAAQIFNKEGLEVQVSIVQIGVDSKTGQPRYGGKLPGEGFEGVYFTSAGNVREKGVKNYLSRETLDSKFNHLGYYVEGEGKAALGNMISNRIRQHMGYTEAGPSLAKGFGDQTTTHSDSMGANTSSSLKEGATPFGGRSSRSGAQNMGPMVVNRINSSELNNHRMPVHKVGYTDTGSSMAAASVNEIRYTNFNEKKAAAAAASVTSHTSGMYDDSGIDAYVKRVNSGRAGNVTSLQKENPRMLAQTGPSSFDYAPDRSASPHYGGVPFSSGGQHISAGKVERRLRSLGITNSLPTGGPSFPSSTYRDTIDVSRTGFRTKPLGEVNPQSFKALDVNMAAMERLHSEGVPRRGWVDNSFLHPDTMARNLKSGVDWKDSPLRGLKDTVDKINKGLKETFLSKASESSVIAQMARVAGGGKGGIAGGISGKVSMGAGEAAGAGASAGGFGSQFAQQLRHAVAWQMYMPAIGAVAGYAGSAVSPFSSKAAMELQGLGATPKEMRLARNMGYNISEDPYRQPQQNIQVDKRIMSAYGMAPTVMGQLEARELGQYLPFVEKATEMKPEPAVQIMSRLRTGMPDRTKTAMQQSIQIASGMTKAGQMTDVMGNEVVQALEYGMSGFTQMFPGDKGAAEALAFVTPLIQRGVPGVGRASQHLTNPEALGKIAHSQVMSEVNSQRMAANGGNLAYAVNETQFKKMLKGKTAEGQDLRNRVQMELQNISSNTTAEQWTKRIARYGGQRDWHLRHGIDSPTVDSNLDRMSIGAFSMLSTEESRNQYGNTVGGIKEGYYSSSIKKDKENARPIDDTPSNYATGKREVENMAINNEPIDHAMREGAKLLVEAGLDTKIKQHLKGDYTPAERKALMDSEYKNYAYAVTSGQMNAPEGGFTVKQQFAHSIDTQAARIQGEKNFLNDAKKTRNMFKKAPYIGAAAGWVYEQWARASMGALKLPGIDYLTDQVVGGVPGVFDGSVSGSLGFRDEAQAYDPNNIGRTGSTRNIPGDINWNAKERKFREQGLFPGVKPEAISDKDVKDPLSMVKVKDGYLQVTIEPSQIQDILKANKGYSIASSVSTDGKAFEYTLKPSAEKKSPADSSIAPPPETNRSYLWGESGRRQYPDSSRY